jgi:hypothetical protein
MLRTFITFLLFFPILVLSSCKLAVILVDGGEVKSSFGTCYSGNICIIENLPGENSAEQFTAVPDPGWYFHRWNSGARFICGDSALPECELNFNSIEDDHELIEKLRASSEFLYLMPVFKEYPRVTLGSEPRTIVVDGKTWQWRQPADFIGFSYEEVAEVCPKNSCSGLLLGETAGSTVSLDGHFWASREDVDLLFLAYHQAGKSVLEDFRETFPTPSSGAVIGLVNDEPKRTEKSELAHVTGVWFWRILD